jgi:hypothetical protein
MSDHDLCASHDLLRDPRRVFLFYGLPILAIVGAGAAPIADVWRGAVWAIACLAMGSACLVNALTCGRVHCYLTAPFAIAMGIVAVLYGAGVLALGRDGWNILGLVLMVGSVALIFIPELLFGKYRSGGSARV